jgi:hypothetical protein
MAGVLPPVLRPRHRAGEKQSCDGAERRNFRDRVGPTGRRRRRARPQPLVGGVVQRRFEMKSFFVGCSQLAAKIFH